ncbi:hypothetical protein [Actinocatenispora rupis]|uniref:Uncharacterized protein n=1 Tax=Actinocatenispora rupis TaxID=519421 RepID=A0A8J3J8Y7_9ACTN|nr:hypothetical protein [Actinocatenispora rupis]GID14087.1 hypothetical protein Aru02nite_49760 [Actinocatenispora rupis]
MAQNKPLLRRLGRALMDKHKVTAWMAEAADKVAGEYNRRTHSSVSVEDFMHTVTALGGGDFHKGMQQLRGMSPKQMRSMKF